MHAHRRCCYRALVPSMLSTSIARGVACRPRLGTKCHGLKENVAALPAPTGVKRITFPQLQHAIEPMPGKMASVAIYSHLATKHDGKLTAAAAQEALDLYAEVVADAKAHPGSHPNIDLLFKVLDSGMHVDIVVDRE